MSFKFNVISIFMQLSAGFPLLSSVLPLQIWATMELRYMISLILRFLPHWFEDDMICFFLSSAIQLHLSAFTCIIAFVFNNEVLLVQIRFLFYTGVIIFFIHDFNWNSSDLFSVYVSTTSGRNYFNRTVGVN